MDGCPQWAHRVNASSRGGGSVCNNVVGYPQWAHREGCSGHTERVADPDGGGYTEATWVAEQHPRWGGVSGGNTNNMEG